MTPSTITPNAELRKSSIIDQELERLNIDIAALQETRLLGLGSIAEKNYTFFWKGKNDGEKREHGVAFAVRKSFLPFIVPPTDGNERMISMKLHTNLGVVSLINIYAPTMQASTEVIDVFYTQLDHVVMNILKSEQLFILGDFNARVGADVLSWSPHIGCFGVGKLNSNGRRLLEFTALHNLCITNTFYGISFKRRVSWRHPRSKDWHQLDHILTRRSFLSNVSLTRCFHSADCDTDHALLCSIVKLKPKKIHRSKQPGKARINTTNIGNKDKQNEFQFDFQKKLLNSRHTDNVDHQWQNISKAIHSAAIQTFGKQKPKSKDWYEDSATVLNPLRDIKRRAFLRNKHHPTRGSLAALRKARNLFQHKARECANQYWQHMCTQIQTASDSGNIKAMYDGINCALGRQHRKSSPLKSKDDTILYEKADQLARWAEYYYELYSNNESISPDALQSIPSLHTMNDLDKDPSIEELEEAIDALKTGKAPGEDNIPPEVIKYCKASLLQPLNELLLSCWHSGNVPQDMRNSKIVTLYKKKGSRMDCSNYRGISLLSVVRKVFARILLSRLRVLADRVYSDSQCGFRGGRSTIDMIFALKQVQEKCREQNMPLYVAFIDLTKAFDLINRKALFSILIKIGCPMLLKLLKSFHENTYGRVSFNNDLSESFCIQSGVKQGCVLAPTLFGIYFAVVLNHTFNTLSSDCGIALRTRIDGGLFNQARLRAKSKTHLIHIRDLLYADDAAFVAHSGVDLQATMTVFSSTCQEFGLTISVAKTKVMHSNNITDSTTIKINDTTLEDVDKFTYLGSTATANLSLDVEIDTRLSKAAIMMARLKNRVWRNNSLTVKTKIKVYVACVLSTLLYASETWTTYKRQEKQLNAFHMRSLRRILYINWQDKVSNANVLKMAGCHDIFTMLTQRRLRWLGHTIRMDCERIPKQLLYSELALGKRNIGRPLLRYKDACKRDITSAGIDVKSTEILANDRTSWRSTVHSATESSENLFYQHQAELRQAQKARDLSHETTAVFTCPSCARQCKSRIGLHSHLQSCRKQLITN